jgi:hypothetical protein
MKLLPGQRLRWELVSENEVRVLVEKKIASADPEKALGFGPRLRRDSGRKTAEWMRELRSDHDWCFCLPL